MFRRKLLLLSVIALVARPALPQHYQTDFPPEEFKARWQKVFDRIGDQAVAVVQGAPMTNGFIYPRQFNSFYYLCGIETPGSYILLDGRAKKVTLYLPPRNAALENAEGKVLSANDAELVMRLTGADDVKPTETMMASGWPLSAGPGTAPGQGGLRPQGGPRGGGPVAIYAEFAPAEGAEQSRGELRAADRAIASDYWDGRISREARFLELLRLRNGRAEIKDFNPILDELRSIKSPREVALVRRASQLAGLGLMEAMRSTEPGVTEYQLDAAARYVFLVNGARLEAYRSITAAGVENINNMHYYRNTGELKEGDMVLMDYAPDYHYYVSDIGRMWPVNGNFAPWQRELLQFVLEYRNAVMTRIRPGIASQQIMDEAAKAMGPVFERTRFSKDIYEKAARQLVRDGGGVFSHTVGMAVHDVGGYRGQLKPGQVFSIDPQLRVKEENLYIRYEDTVMVTETGVENFTDFLPSELNDIEKLVQEKGIVQRVPPIPESQINHPVKK